MLYCIVCFSSTTFALAPIIIGRQLVELCVFLARPAIAVVEVVVVVVVVNYNNNNDNYNDNNDDDNYNNSNGIIMFKYVYLLATQLFISA